MLWKRIFGLNTKKVEILNIDDEYSSGEISCVLSPQDNMSPIHANTHETLEVEKTRLTNEVEDGEERETNENDKIFLAPHIEEEKESNKAESSETIVV